MRLLVLQVQQNAPLRLGVNSAKDSEVKGRRAALATVIHGTVALDESREESSEAHEKLHAEPPPAKATKAPPAKIMNPSLANRLAKSQKEHEEFYQRSLTEQELADLEVRAPAP